MSDKNLEFQIAITNTNTKKVSEENEDVEISNMKWDKYEYKSMESEQEKKNLIFLLWSGAKKKH